VLYTVTDVAVSYKTSPMYLYCMTALAVLNVLTLAPLGDTALEGCYYLRYITQGSQGKYSKEGSLCVSFVKTSQMDRYHILAVAILFDLT
jgi:hypothetical protein